jgi:4-amino-4-deoxy-L-arabinose transferase-like glycosyltransferase
VSALALTLRWWQAFADPLRPALLWRLYATAALVYLPALAIPYVGEEAITVIVTQEMWARQDFLVTNLYGTSYGRPGLFSWLMLPVVALTGWDHILVAARLVTIAATLSTGLILACLVRRIFRDDRLAALAAAIYLSGDILVYRGWLAYADPLFAMLVFASMAALWIAAAERRLTMLALGALAVCAAFLAKTGTGYVFFGGTALVLLWRHDHRDFLLKPQSIAVFAAAAVFPLLWDVAVGHTVIKPLLDHILFHLDRGEAWAPLTYLAHLVWYPLRTAWYLLPASAIAVGCVLHGRFPWRGFTRGPIDIAVWVALINALPYWLAPDGGTRYLMPLYPLFALVMAHVILSCGERVAQVTVKALMATVLVGFVVTAVGFPLYQRHVRGSHLEAARAILARAGDAPIFAIDTSAVGTSIVAHLNVLRAPQPPIEVPPQEGFGSGLVLTIDPEARFGRVAGVVMVGRAVRHLMCRGPACIPAWDRVSHDGGGVAGGAADGMLDRPLLQAPSPPAPRSPETEPDDPPVLTD